jgi:hypothetical protein
LDGFSQVGLQAVLVSLVVATKLAYQPKGPPPAALVLALLGHTLQQGLATCSLDRQVVGTSATGPDQCLEISVENLRRLMTLFVHQPLAVSRGFLPW